MSNQIFRIGQGYDIHKFVKGRSLIIGGTNIPHDFGLLGHSDGDALCHAIIDALVGAAGMGDIGTHFPDDNQKYKNAESKKLLKEISDKVSKNRWQIVNLDCTIITEKPRLATFINQIKNSIAKILSIDSLQINIKAKTNEKLDAVGREEALSVLAVVLLSKEDPHNE